MNAKLAILFGIVSFILFSSVILVSYSSVGGFIVLVSSLVSAMLALYYNQKPDWKD